MEEGGGRGAGRGKISTRAAVRAAAFHSEHVLCLEPLSHAKETYNMSWQTYYIGLVCLTRPNKTYYIGLLCHKGPKKGMRLT